MVSNGPERIEEIMELGPPPLPAGKRWRAEVHDTGAQHTPTDALFACDDGGRITVVLPVLGVEPPLKIPDRTR
jgi:hypothetical protein